MAVRNLEFAYQRIDQLL